MTVASETARSGPYVGNGSTTQFAYTFRILDASHLTVIKTAVSGADTTLTLTTDYTVDGVGNASGGNVTMVAAPATGEKITILRGVPLTQETDWQNQGPFYAETVEDAVDKLTMAAQQLDERLDRAVFLGASTTATNVTIPEPVAGRVLGWNAAETDLENQTVLAGAIIGTGVVVQTADAIFTTRTITGTAGEIIVSNGDGVSGNPTLSLDATTFFKGLMDDPNGATFRGSIGANNAGNLNAGTIPSARLPDFVGDGGSGGTKGAVPAPVAGDASKFLQGDGSWGIPAGTGIGMWGGTSGGSANAQTVSTDLNLPSYTAGERVTFIAGFTNTSALTLNRDGLGARNVFVSGAAMTGGEMVAGNTYTVVDDGTQYRLATAPNRFEFKATIADDAATSVAAPAQSGVAIIVIGGASHITQSTIIVYRAATTPVLSGQRIATIDTSLVQFTTGTLAGTTGTDTRFTISAHTDGRIYFENRLGTSRNIAVSFLAPVIA